MDESKGYFFIQFDHPMFAEVDGNDVFSRAFVGMFGTWVMEYDQFGVEPNFDDAPSFVVEIWEDSKKVVDEIKHLGKDNILCHELSFTQLVEHYNDRQKSVGEVS